MSWKLAPLAFAAAVSLVSASAFAAAPPRPNVGPQPDFDPCWYAPRLIQCSPWFLGHMPVAPTPDLGGGGHAPFHPAQEAPRQLRFAP